MTLTISSVEEYRKAIQSEKPVLVDFWAPWCAPCKAIGKIVDGLANDYAGKAIIAKVNIDDVPKLATELEISSIPLVKFFKNGQEIETIAGVASKAESRFRQILDGAI